MLKPSDSTGTFHHSFLLNAGTGGLDSLGVSCDGSAIRWPVFKGGDPIDLGILTFPDAWHPVGSGGIRWRIVDSSWIEPSSELLDSLLIYRVAVMHGTALDTIRDVVPPWPVIINDSSLVGLRVDRATLTRELFSIAGTIPGFRLVFLPDLQPDFYDVAVSPDGRYVAYVATDSMAAPFAMIRSLRDGSLVLRGQPTSGCDCDIDLNHARWISPDSVELAIVDAVAGRGWQVYSANVRTLRSHVSSQASEPDWPGPGFAGDN